MINHLTHNQKTVEQVEAAAKEIILEMGEAFKMVNTGLLYKLCMRDVILKRQTFTPYSVMTFFRIKSSQYTAFNYLFTERLKWKNVRTEGDEDTIDLVFTESIKNLVRDTLNG